MDWRAMRRWWMQESGATSIEYALIASLIAVAIIGTLRVIGTDVVTVLYNKVATGVSGSM